MYCRWLLIIWGLLLVSKEGLCQFTISGTVTDKKGIPLPGVTVVEKETGNGKSTDSGGKFTLELRSDTATIRFSFIGYATKSISVSRETKQHVTIVVALEDDTSILCDLLMPTRPDIGYISGVKFTPFGFVIQNINQGAYRIPISLNEISFTTNFKGNYVFYTEVNRNLYSNKQESIWVNLQACYQNLNIENEDNSLQNKNYSGLAGTNLFKYFTIYTGLIYRNYQDQRYQLNSLGSNTIITKYMETVDVSVSGQAIFFSRANQYKVCAQKNILYWLKLGAGYERIKDYNEWNISLTYDL